MILSGKKIHEELKSGNIAITGGKPKFNPASVNLTLDNLFYSVEVNNDDFIDPRKKVKYQEIHADDNIVLYPGYLYLGSTVESITAGNYAIEVEGRSSWGRLGLTIHVTAGFIDPGFNGTITLEMTVTRPLLIPIGCEICQIVYHQVDGEIDPYKGKYQNQNGVKESLLNNEFNC